MKAPTTQARPKSRPSRRRGGARRGLRGGPLVVGLVLVLLASPALAQAPSPDHARLDYQRPDNLKSCPEAIDFRAYVSKSFGGVDPFTADAPRRITLTLVREPGAFVAKLAVSNQAGKVLGKSDPDFRESDCAAVVWRAGDRVVTWLVPTVRLAHVPALPPPRAEPAPVLQPAAPIAARLEVRATQPAPPVPVLPLQPRTFEGKPGIARALLYGFTAGGLAIGTTSLLAAGNKLGGAHGLLATLPQNRGAPCTSDGPAPPAACQQIPELLHQHDTYTDVAIASFVTAGVMGGVATASIWIPRSPIASAPANLAGLTVRGSW